MNGLKALAAVCAVLISVGPAVAQEAGDIGSVPNFIPLQDHFALTDGQAVYTYWCWNCHGEGPGKPGTTALKALNGDAVPAVLHERTDLDGDYIRHIVREGVSIMPHFRLTQISRPQLDALVAYLTANNPE